VDISHADTVNLLPKWKYRCPKSGGHHWANENPAKKKKRREHGPKNYVYGDVIGVLNPLRGKMRIVRVIQR
jgi:hypothetical protein